jgi:hypothetical protein
LESSEEGSTWFFYGTGGARAPTEDNYYLKKGGSLQLTQYRRRPKKIRKQKRYKK